MSNPIVTLCIPLYNGAATIAATLDSLLKQSLPASKIKVFDNQSTDHSVQVVKDYCSRYPTIELFINEANIGAEGNFTRCLQAAEGDYCAIVHSDDIYHPHYIAEAVQALEDNPEAVATFCHAVEIDDQERVIGERFWPKELADRTNVLDSRHLKQLIYRYGNFITCPSVFARSSVYRDQISTWRGQQFKTSADLDVWFRLLEIGKLIGIKQPLIHYRVAEVSHSFRIAKKRITRHDLFLVLDHYKDPGVEEDFAFLKLKDQAIRSLNMIRNHQAGAFPIEQSFHLSLVIKKMFQSKWHFKFGISILGIKVLTSCYRLIKRKQYQ